jgi:hypothetical protein
MVPLSSLNSGGEKRSSFYGSGRSAYEEAPGDVGNYIATTMNIWLQRFGSAYDMGCLGSFPCEEDMIQDMIQDMTSSF